MPEQAERHGCSCNLNRRDFLATVGGVSGLVALNAVSSTADESHSPSSEKRGARVRVVFLYPPSQQFAEDVDGWWSWPGNEFDAEGRQATYVTALKQIEAKLGMQVEIEDSPLATSDEAQRCANEWRGDPPDGVLLVMFYNRSLPQADALLKTAEELNIPAVFFVGLGVKHGTVTQYRRPGVYFIQSLDNMEAIEYGLRMINTRKRLGQTRILSVTEADEPREGVEAFFGITVRVIPFSQYAEAFQKVTIDDRARDFIRQFTAGATEIRGVTQTALENAARAHFSLKALLEREQADGVTMNCLRRGMLKPCMSFASLNSQLIAAACENDLPAAYTQLLGQQLAGRPGFQHNPCFETERNHYYASHCTCATKLNGPEGGDSPYLLRRFAHTNEGSCAIQVFWKPDDPVTMMRYYPGKEPSLDVYSGKVIASHPMPPAAGCTTNVEIQLTDRSDATMVRGHHNLIFCGDYARRFRLFAQLYKMRLAETGYDGPWPV